MATTMVKASEARKALFGLMGRSERLRERFIITRDGRPQSVLMSAGEYEEWVETLEILRDRVLVRKIARGLEDERKGRLHSHREVFGRPFRAKS